jgi:hypothetical protein
MTIKSDYRAASAAGRPGAIGPSYLGKARKTAALMPVNLTTSPIGSKISEFKGQHRSPSGDEEICPDNWTLATGRHLVTQRIAAS